MFAEVIFSQNDFWRLETSCIIAFEEKYASGIFSGFYKYNQKLDWSWCVQRCGVKLQTMLHFQYFRVHMVDRCMFIFT